MTFTLAFLYLRSKIAALGGWAIKNPAWALSAFLALTTLWFWHEDSIKGKFIAEFKKAQKNEATMQKKDVFQTETAVTTLNTKTEKTYEQGIIDGRASLAGWVRANSTASRPDSTPQDYVAAVPATTGSGTPAVALTESQLAERLHWGNGDRDYAKITKGPSAAAPAVALTEAQLAVWDQTYQDDQSCRTWASGIAKMFDGKHWPTAEELETASPTTPSNTDTAKP